MRRLTFFLSITLALAAWLVANWPTLGALHAKWIDVGDSYVLGYPLLAVAVWLIYRGRQQLAREALKPSWIGVLFFATSILLIYTARLIQLQIAQLMLLPVSLWLTFFALAGWSFGRRLFVPIALQYFGMPIWDFLIAALQSITLGVSRAVLSLARIPIWVQSNHIHLPDGIITVAGSCSGLNLLLAMLLIAIIQSEIGSYTIGRRIQLFLIAGTIGLLDNWIRVLALIFIAHYSHMQSKLVYSHASFGWWIYVGSLIPFLWVARGFERPSKKNMKCSLLVESSTAKPINQLVAIIALVVACENVSLLLSHRIGGANELQLVGAEPISGSEFSPHYSGFDRQQSWQINSGDSRYELSAYIYLQQKENKKLVYYDNFIADESHLGSIGTVKGGKYSINYAVVNSSAQSWIVWWFYWVDGAITTSAMRAKLYQLRAILVGDPSAALVIMSQKCIEASCVNIVEKAREGGFKDAFDRMYSIRRAK